ncbi:hypothetical protein K1T71_003115 [Dendrolimus kikuchii]|uniref:Uncharacterized protein n=1 Tax=Dendrolimus kikuchii TaxID=765133 RepID=A0ACC1DB20_9NEOP|nr:hypothetical protein K1T71_003115 [Dendrolimus kikuchii]
MSALSTPGGGGTTAQSKPTSGKQKFQKLDINSLYCVNRNESSEPSSVKSQLSRKHGMQSLGKVPSARRPPANLPSLKTETGQDPNTNSVSVAVTTVSTPPTCTSQTVTTTSSSSVGAASCGGGWVALPPPSSPHFRTEFPSLEAAAQPSHRSAEHSAPQPQLRPQTEGSWTSGGNVGVRDAASPAAPPPAPALQQTPALRAILPPFLMKAAGSGGGGLGLGSAGAVRERGGALGPAPAHPPPPARAPHRPAPTPRAVEVLTARPILRDDQISSLDDISRDAGWAQNDDIDYDQKLDFSDGESSASNRGGGKNSNRLTVDTERTDPKLQEPGDEEQLWAERRQKQSNEVAQAVARARQRKEEEQRRQLRDAAPTKEFRDKQDRIERPDRDRNDNRDREPEARDKDRVDNRERERTEGRDRERADNREKERNEPRDRETREKERGENRDRDRNDNRYESRERERDTRDSDRDRLDNRGRIDNRDRPDSDKERTDGRDRDRNDNRERIDRDRFDRDRQDRDRDRDRADRENRDRDRNDRDRERNDRDRERDRDFRESRDYGREREQNNPGFSKTFQENIPPRFLKLQQNRQQEDHKPWAFSGKPATRRQEPSSYNAPRHAPHNTRRSYSRDYSDREDDFRREKEGLNPQWRSEMQEYDRSGRELDRSNSKDSYKENEFKDKRPEPDKKPIENPPEISGRSAAEKLTEVFERKSIGVIEPVIATDSSNQIQPPERKSTPPSNVISQRDSSERDLSKTSWAEVAQEEPSNYVLLKSSIEKVALKEISSKKDLHESESEDCKRIVQQSIIVQQNISQPTPVTLSNVISTTQIQQQKLNSHTPNVQSFGQNQNTSQSSFIIQSQSVPSVTQPQNTSNDNQSVSKSITTSLIKPNPTESLPSPLPIQKPLSSNEPQQNVVKPIFASQKSEKDVSESESIASKSSTDPSNNVGLKATETYSVESLHSNTESQKRAADEKKPERYSNEQLNKIPGKEPIERKSSGSGSEKKGRGGYGGGYAVYNRGWGPRESRGRRSHRSSRSNNRASESDGSTDGAPAGERKDRRRTPRSPRGPKKSDRPEDAPRPTSMDPVPPPADAGENREPFAPRGQPSRRGRGGFQGTSRPPAPAKRVTGYGPPNTKSPFSQVNRAVKENEESKENVQGDDKTKGNNKSRTGSSGGRGRDRRPKGLGGPLSGEDENWETTSEHSEGGSAGGRRRTAAGGQPGASSRGQIGRNPSHRQNIARNPQAGKPTPGDNKPTDITEAMTDLKISVVKKDDEIVDDGFQEVRNKKNSKDARPTKEEIQNPNKQPRSGSNQGGGRNSSSSRNPSDKSNLRNNAPVTAKPGPQYDRPRQANLAPRFVKQRQKQQLGLVSNFGPDTGGAPPPPPVNAWDKPISQTLRGNVEEIVEPVDIKSTQSSQRSSPADTPSEVKPVTTACAPTTDKTGVLDGTTPPVETIIFENTNYKTTPPDEALQQKYQMAAATIPKPQPEEISTEIEPHPLTFNGDVRPRPRSIQELISDNGRTGSDGEVSLGLQMSFDTSQKTEDSSDMKLDFAFDSDLGQLTEDKSAKALVLPRGVHMSTSNTISPLAADLNLKIASVKKVWEMPAVAEGGEELQFAGFEESGVEAGAPPNVCKVKPTQQLQSPPPQHYNHVGYQGGYGGLSVSSPPAAVLFNSSQQLLGSSQQLPQQGGLYGAFLDQSRGQFSGFPGTPYGAGSAAPYNYQPPPDMFQSLPNQYRMAAAAGGGAAFGQTGQMANSPSTVLISSTSNSLMSATVKPSTQQIGAIGSKGGGVGGVGGVNTYQQQYLGYSTQVGEAPYSLPGLLPRPAPPATSYYSPYQPPAAPPAPTYPLQFTQPAQSGAFGSQFLSSPLQVAAAAAVQQMQQYRGPMQQQYAAPQPRPPPQQQLKSPLHEHANGFSPLCEAASPTPKGAPKPQKPPHSPPQHKYHAPPPHPPPAHTPHQHHQQQQLMSGGNNGRCGSGGGAGAAGGGGGAAGGGGGAAMARGGMVAPRYPAPIQRPHAPAMPLYRAPPTPQPRVGAHHAQARPNLYYHHHQRNGGSGGGGDRAAEGADAAGASEECGEAAAATDAAPGAAEPKPE